MPKNSDRMTDSEKFLDALDPPDTATAADRADPWPTEIPRLPAPKSEHPLEYQFLSDRTIGGYLNGLRASLNGAAGAERFHVDFANLGRDWTAQKYPLALCEFLAYKSGLVYRSPRQIRQDLLGLDSKGRRYKEGVAQYAFFDTTHPNATVRYTDTQAVAFIHQRTGYLIFRGTSSFADWRTNLHSELTDAAYPQLDTVPQTLVGTPRPARHTGFAIAWGSIAPDIGAWVDDQLRNGRMDGIVLSGHSLGGALAILGAHHFARHRVCPIRAVVTFGAPKVGGADFRAEYESPRLGLKDRTLRIEAADDLVALLSRRWGDEHVGHAWRFKKRPLRSTWKMALFSSLIDAEQSSKKKVERIEKQHRAESEALEQTKAQREAARRARGPSNSETAAEIQRTWSQFAVQMLLKLLWYLAKTLTRALAAHSVEQRYGLYISTLAYKQIRAYHLGQAHLTYGRKRNQESEHILKTCAFREANEDLARHLGVARGRHPRTFRHLQRRPIRIESPEQLAKYEKTYVNYIA